MNKMHKHVTYRLMMTSTFYVIFSFFTMAVVLFAWFTIRNDNDAKLVSKITEIDANYELYIYHHPYSLGDAYTDLLGQLCEEQEAYCYQKMDDRQTFFDDSESLAPGMTFSFVLKVLPLSEEQGYLSIHLGGVISHGFIEEINKIQTAFSYQVDKISYVHQEIETLDVKDTYPIVYTDDHFSSEYNVTYELMDRVPLHYLYGSSDYVLIYFSFYFDPSIKGFDALGEPYENSNVFMNQSLEINQLMMTIRRRN